MLHGVALVVGVGPGEPLGVDGVAVGVAPVPDGLGVGDAFGMQVTVVGPLAGDRSGCAVVGSTL
jgi:hypothetical protein